MAAECARNALLGKVMDNKEDPGIGFSNSQHQHLIYLIGFIY